MNVLSLMSANFASQTRTLFFLTGLDARNCAHVAYRALSILHSRTHTLYLLSFSPVPVEEFYFLEKENSKLSLSSTIVYLFISLALTFSPFSPAPCREMAGILRDFFAARKNASSRNALAFCKTINERYEL